MEFDQWWEYNKDLYLQIGVTKEVAYSIWSAAALSIATAKLLEKYK